MNALELKIPPPLVALAAAAATWIVSRHTPALPLPGLLRAMAAVAIALAGGAFSLGGLLAFRAAKTTVNPMKPESASSLVSSGVYRLTRNPMYLGLSLVLVAWAVLLASAWALVGPLCFVFYIGRFQIAPEERVLARMFGEQFAQYKSRVRRWL